MFTSDEESLIEEFSKPGGWDRDEVSDLKIRIRKYFINRKFICCCYCQRTMNDWDKFDIDTEHVLPKSKFPQWMFNLTNLNIACKRCNMRIKREDYSFYKGHVDDQNPFKSELYSFLHPNLDNVEGELDIEFKQIGREVFIKYFINIDNRKAVETYQYFQLKKIETDLIDKVQGLAPVVLSDTIPLDEASKTQDLLGENSRI